MVIEIFDFPKISEELRPPSLRLFTNALRRITIIQVDTPFEWWSTRQTDSVRNRTRPKTDTNTTLFYELFDHITAFAVCVLSGRRN